MIVLYTETEREQDMTNKTHTPKTKQIKNKHTPCFKDSTVRAMFGHGTK